MFLFYEVSRIKSAWLIRLLSLQMLLEQHSSFQRDKQKSNRKQTNKTKQVIDKSRNHWIIFSSKSFGGLQKIFEYCWTELKIKFEIYLLPQAGTEKISALYWLSGAICIEQKFFFIKIRLSPSWFRTRLYHYYIRYQPL